MNIAYVRLYCIENQKYKAFLLAEKSGRNIDVFNPKNGQKHHFSPSRYPHSRRPSSMVPRPPSLRWLFRKNRLFMMAF